MISEIRRILRITEDPVVKMTIIREYLKNGSIGEEVVSRRDLQRILKENKIIPTAQSRDEFGSTLSFLAYASRHGVNLKTAYLKAQACNIHVDVSVINEVVSQIRNGQISRAGTALVIVPEDYPDMVLIGKDITTPDLDIGKFFGSLSLPMGYSELEEDPIKQVIRVSQREVWSEKTVQNNFPYDVIPRKPRPIMYLKIAHIAVECYYIKLPREMCNLDSFSSGKLINHRFVNIDDILKTKDVYRTGVQEIVTCYAGSLIDLYTGYGVSPVIKTSNLNKQIMNAFA